MIGRGPLHITVRDANDAMFAVCNVKVVFMLVLVTTLPPPVFTLQPPTTAAALLLHPATHQKRDVFVHTSIHQCCNSHILTNFPDLGNLKSQGALHSSVAHSGPSVCRMQVSKWTQDVWMPGGWRAGELERSP